MVSEDKVAQGGLDAWRAVELGRVGLGSLACELTLGTCYYPVFPINLIHLPALSGVFPLMIRGIEKSN